MLIVNPAKCEDRMVYRTQALADAVGALGTADFGGACFRVFLPVAEEAASAEEIERAL